MFSRTFLSLILMTVAIFSLVWTVNAQQERDWRKAEEEKKKQYEEERNKKIPKEKFRKVGVGIDKVKDEYIVALKSETPIDQIDQLVDDLLKKYKFKIVGGKIKDKEGKETSYGIWKGQSLKGFGAIMSEEIAKAVSEDPRVEYVAENSLLKQPTQTNDGVYHQIKMN